MTKLTLRLLGAPHIARDGAPVAMDTRKATALLAFLAVTGRSHARETLAALLWPEYDDEHARAALRRTLSTLRAALGETHMAIDREMVGLIPDAGLWVDVAEFHARLAACRTHGHSATAVCHACLAPLTEAAKLYRDGFLAGFTLRDSAEFDDWPFALQARLGAVAETARQALQAAAVIGRSFDLEALLATSGRSHEEIVSALEILANRGIVREVPEDTDAAPRYDFTHEKLRALVYDKTSLARRRLLPGRAARSLSERARLRRDLEPQVAQIGRHFQLAEQDASAADCCALAGDHAHSLYANASALAHYQAALSPGPPRDEPPARGDRRHAYASGGPRRGADQL